MPAIRIAEFDTWRPGYGQATVRVLLAGTSTLASIYSDEELTTALDNPQTLTERVDDDGISYGHFAQPIYIGVPYELEINSVDHTGVQRVPLTTLEDEDASDATVIVDGGSEDHTLAEHLARRIDVQDYGAFIAVGEQGASTATNSATLLSAVGVAGAQGGGFVELPSGTYRINQLTLPEGVILRGQGKDATTIQSTTAGRVITVAGTGAGLCRMTLDGISLPLGSIGLYAADQDGLVLNDVLIKRFATGLHRDGGAFCQWENLSISNCTYGYRGHGDESDDNSSELKFNLWRGGGVDTCVTKGIELKHDGQLCSDNIFQNLFFDSNLAIAVDLEGARATSLRDCRWENNTKNIVGQDGDAAASTIIGLDVVGGSMEDGTIELSDTLSNVAFRSVVIDDVDVTLTSPGNAVLVEDCTESSTVTIAGATTAWLRHETGNSGSTFGVTVGNAATKAWAITLDSGDHVYLEGKVIAKQRNAVGHAFYHIAVSARRPGATLLYDTQTGNFTAGLVLTGATSGATARIQADSDSGTTGTLTLIDVVGTFVDNEIIADSSTGSAMANGAVSTSNAALVGSVAALRTAQETDSTWEATFVANGPEIELQVTGASSKTIEWTCNVEVVAG